MKPIGITLSCEMVRTRTNLGGSQEVGQGPDNAEVKLDCIMAMMDETKERLGNLE